MILRTLASLALAAVSATAFAQFPAYDAAPRIGVLIPKGPPEYSQWYTALKDRKDVVDGPFQYNSGTIAGVPVVLYLQPTDGVLARALGEFSMIRDFNVKTVIYAGTSGGHLPKGQMGVGDIVLGAQNVNHGAYHLLADGTIDPGTFNSMQKDMLHFDGLYADPKMLQLLACSAKRVADTTKLPAFSEPVRRDTTPQVFYFGIQGTSTIWSDNKAYTEATMKVFHEIDEDGDWASNLAATLYKVPFIEVSVISNSIYAYPTADHGTPKAPKGEANSHLLAQRISNRVALDLIEHDGQRLLTGTWTEPTTSPFPESFYNDPLNPQALLKDCK
ncbi:hypothetical protein ACFQBQ_03755 [Granulicella cerasi]|uniref:Nucleoside phosphorylase domain-containing protein n=1 Tax=Granulicella cerasi TaxID=741063 RepID=A0ABW1Z8I5_9BACT|nr:hypothetical protein [Granulicella cerasi]